MMLSVHPPFYDVVILGGGPAGVAAGIELKKFDRTLRVLLVEAEMLANWHVGETLAPGARQLLEGLGCWGEVARDGVLESVQTMACWGSDRPHANEFMLSTRGNAWHLDRAAFNETLRAAAEAAGVAIWRATRFEGVVQGRDGRWRLTLCRNGQPLAVAAEFVVDASGRSARFAAALGHRPHFADRLVGIAAIVQLREKVSPDRATLVEACENGWWYSSPVPGGKLVLVWMSDADIVHCDGLAGRERWFAHLRAAPATAARALRAEAPDRITTWSARSHCLDPVRGPRWVAVGDAASSWDPLSSAGILKALRTGKLGAFALLDAIRGVEGGPEKYRRIISADYARYRQDRREVYRMERRWSRSPFWQRRHHDKQIEEPIALRQSGGR
jgi:2-polyprenyl-6-methoxyphenol hydroxylase-like FAD-dependent oxidoreductase